MSTFYLKNETGATVVIDDLGINLPDDTSLVIDSNEIPGYLSADLITSLEIPELVLSTTDVGNSGGDLSISDAEDALKITSRYDRDNPHSVTVTQAITADIGTDITVAELEELSDGSETALHIHDNRYYTEVELGASNAGTVTVHWDNITNAPTFGSLEWKEPALGNLTGMGATGSEPVSPTTGDFFLNTTDDHLYQYDGSSWVDQGAATTGDRVVFKDGVGSNDYIYEWDGAAWITDPVPLDNWAIIVSDDGDGHAAQYVYDSSGLPPDWIKIADVDWGSHSALADRTSTGSHPATAISYINTTSGLTATEVQAAIDELDGSIDTIISNLSTHEGDTTNPHSVTFTQAVSADGLTDILASEAETLTDGSNADLLHKHNADNIVYDNTISGLTSINVQDAINELSVEFGVEIDETYFVAKNGVDVNPEVILGTISNPYLTVQAAINAAAASSSSYPVVFVWPGTYAENLTIPSYVVVYALGREPTKIGTNAGTHSITFNGSGRVFFRGVNFRLDAFNITHTALSGGSAVVHFEDCSAGAITFNGLGWNDYLQFRGACWLFEKLTVHSAHVTFFNGETQITLGTGDISLELDDIGAEAFDATSGQACTAVLRDVEFGNKLLFEGKTSSWLYNCGIYDTVTADGADCEVAYDVGSAPQDRTDFISLNAATYTRLDDAHAIEYDPNYEPSGLVSVNVQDAIDELDTNISTVEGSLTTHEGDTTNPHSVTFTQAVAADIGTDITVIEAETLTDGSNADLLHVHDAEKITFTSNSGLSSINVESALDELHTDILDFKMPRGTAFPLNPEAADLFYLTTMNMAFQYDVDRSLWISMTQMFLDWGANVADGKYLKIHGAAATQTGYLMPHSGVILNVTARCASGNQTKGFAIRKNHDSVTQLHTFALSGGEYSSTSLSVAFNQGDYLQTYATSVGVPSRDVVVMATIAYTG